jgi:hypothetical protein
MVKCRAGTVEHLGYADADVPSRRKGPRLFGRWYSKG